MLDFKIDNNGELILNELEPFSKFNINFRISKYPIFNIKFLQEKEYIRSNHDNMFNIKFNTNTDLKDVNDSKNESVFNLEELKQRIIIHLRTERNELLSSNLIGSDIYTYKHKDLLAESTQQGISDTVTKELKTLFEDLKDKDIEVKVYPYKIDNPFYCQNLNVEIHIDKEFIYNFNL